MPMVLEYSNLGMKCRTKAQVCAKLVLGWWGLFGEVMEPLGGGT